MYPIEGSDYEIYYEPPNNSIFLLDIKHIHLKLKSISVGHSLIPQSNPSL
jgi:hypothetical protein